MAKKASPKRGKSTTTRSTSKKAVKPAPKATARKVAKSTVKSTTKTASRSSPSTKKKSATKKTATRTVATTARSETRRAAATKPAATAVAKAKPAGSSRPKKKQSGLTKRDLDHFRELLLEKRRELVGDMSSMEREALNPSGGTNLSNLPVHMADMGTDNYEQEFTLGLVEKDRMLLREINNALARIQDGTYGICEGTGEPIGKPRLEAKPWARHSIEYARKVEQGLAR